MFCLSLLSKASQNFQGTGFMGGAEGSPTRQAYNVGRWRENKIFSSVSTSHDDLSNSTNWGCAGQELDFDDPSRSLPAQDI